MKRVYVNEKWCLGCHLCEYYCAFANTRTSGTKDNGSKNHDMARALKDIKIRPRIKIEEKDGISFAVSCRHCDEPYCVKGCITGAIKINDGVIVIDSDRCVSCYTCILSCPFGAVSPSEDSPDGGAVEKCELCIRNLSDRTGTGEPACVMGCPNNAIVFEERITV